MKVERIDTVGGEYYYQIEWPEEATDEEFFLAAITSDKYTGWLEENEGFYKWDIYRNVTLDAYRCGHKWQSYI